MSMIPEGLTLLDGGLQLHAYVDFSGVVEKYL